MSTLYVSDLDGTLLNDSINTSDYTNLTVDMLNKRNICFSYATARSYITAKKVTKGLNIKHPLVVHNGVFIVSCDGEIIIKNTFDQADAEHILSTLLTSGIYPLVYSLIDSKEKFSYIKDKVNAATAHFLSEREHDPRNRAVTDIKQLYDGEIYYFTIIGEESKCSAVYDMFKERFKCYSQYDMYSGDHWLEITDKNATKANAVKQLANILGCDNITAFGDGINDIELFSIADKAYAVENAATTLKELATDVIGKNTDDGVARWLRYNVLKDNYK